MMLKPNYKAIVKQVFDMGRRQGQTVKSDMLRTIWNVHENKLYEHYAHPQTGKPARNVVEWLYWPYPHGPELTLDSEEGSVFLTFNDIWQLAISAGDKELEAVLAKYAGRGKGGDRRSKGYNVNLRNGQAKAKKGNSREYLLRRLQRNHKEIYKQYLNGNFRSVRQAALAANIIKTDTHDPLKRLKSNWNKATKKQRAEFVAWIEEEANW